MPPAEAGTTLADQRTAGTCATARSIPIKVAAQAKGFYTDQLEQQLANSVEGPANPAIDKMLAGGTISDAERHRVAVYVGAMLVRVPAQRSRSRAAYPSELARYCDEFRDELSLHAQAAKGEDAANFQAWIEYLHDFEARHSAQPFDGIVDQIRMPIPDASTVQAIEQMTWRIVEARAPDYFVTSDNPAFMFRRRGLGTEQSELSLPLSPSRALHCSWQEAGSLLVATRASREDVRRINLRAVCTAERLAFAHIDAPWLVRTLRRKERQHGSMVWGGRPRWRKPPEIEPTGRRYEF